MPNRKVTLTAFSRMDHRVEALEEGLNEVRASIAGVQATMRESYANIVALLEKHLGKSIATEGGTSEKKDKPESSEVKNDVTLEFRQSAKKVELPSFDGDDPAGWISRAEVYFRVQGTTPAVKVSLAQLCMDGLTIHFFNSILRENEDLSWEELKEALLERYGGHGEGDVYEQLTDLKQEAIDDYITEFEYLVAEIPRLPEKQYRGYFLHGLKPEIKGRVRSFAALSEMRRTKLLQVARVVEREVEGGSELKPNRGPRFGSGSGSHKNGSQSDWVMVRRREGSRNEGVKSNTDGPKGDRKRTGPRDRGYTQLTYNELMDYKQKGLCFKCKNPFGPMHRCPAKELRVLIVDDVENEEDEERILAVEVGEEEDEKGEMSILNLHHITHETHHTMKFQGTIRGVEVLILVDSGATHNFISQKLVHQMDWPI